MPAIYLVDGPAGLALVNATNQKVAINHVLKKTVTAKALNAVELSAYIKQGLEIQEASEAKPEPETQPTTETSNG